MYLSLLVRAKAAGRKSLPHTGRQWPASGVPEEEESEKAVKIKERPGVVRFTGEE